MSKMPDSMSKAQYESGKRACTCGNYQPYNPQGAVFATMQIGDCVNCNRNRGSVAYTSTTKFKDLIKIGGTNEQEQ